MRICCCHRDQESWKTLRVMVYHLIQTAFLFFSFPHARSTDAFPLFTTKCNLNAPSLLHLSHVNFWCLRVHLLFLMLIYSHLLHSNKPKLTELNKVERLDWSPTVTLHPLRCNKHTIFSSSEKMLSHHIVLIKQDVPMGATTAKCVHTPWLPLKP